MRFYCEYSRGDEDSVHIISELNEIESIVNSGEVIPDIVKEKFINIRHIEGEFKMKGWQYYEACMLYEGNFFISEFRLFQSGKVILEKSDIIAEDLPVMQRKYDGIFRSSSRKKAIKEFDEIKLNFLYYRLFYMLFTNQRSGNNHCQLKTLHTQAE